MKKLLTIVALFGALSLAGITAQAQDKPAEQPAAAMAAPAAAPAAQAAPAAPAVPAPEVKKLDSGSTGWMITA